MKAQAQRMIVALVVAVAAATALAGAAQAEHPNDRAGVLGVGGIAATQTIASPDWFERAAARALADATQANTGQDWFERAAARALAGETQATVSPDWFERAAARALAATSSSRMTAAACSESAPSSRLRRRWRRTGSSGRPSGERRSFARTIVAGCADQGWCPRRRRPSRRLPVTDSGGATRRSAPWRRLGSSCWACWRR